MGFLCSLSMVEGWNGGMMECVSSPGGLAFLVLMGGETRRSLPGQAPGDSGTRRALGVEFWV